MTVFLKCLFIESNAIPKKPAADRKIQEQSSVIPQLGFYQQTVGFTCAMLCNDFGVS